MRSWTIAFSIGVVMASVLPRLPGLPVSLLALAAAILLHCFKPLRLPAALFTGVFWLCCYGQLSLQQRWPEPPFPRDAWVEGTIWTLPVATERGQRFQFRLDRVCTAPLLSACDFAQLPDDRRHVLLTLYEPLVIEPGQRWRWKLRLRPPHGFANPGGFDYEAWLMQQGIDATGYVRDIPAKAMLAAPGTRRMFEQARLHFIRFIDSAGAGQLRYPHLLRALTVGDGSGISDDEWKLFADTGTTHLLVISGSHVALICLWLFAMGYWLSSRSTWLLLRLPASHAAALLALLGAWGYTGLAGFSLPALRALVMAALMLIAVLLRRHCNSLNNLCLALAGILAFDPLAAQNPGFWLSFIAVAVLLHLSPVSIPGDAQQRQGWLNKTWLMTRHFALLQWKLSLALLPVLLVYFQQTSLLAPLVNLLTIPLIGWLIVPLALAGVVTGMIWPWAGGLLLVASDQLLHLTMGILQGSTTLLPANTLILPALSMTGTLLLIVTTIGSLWAPQRRQRRLALALLPCSFLLRVPALEPGSVRMTVLDVGQGLAVMVSTREHHLLYDAGPYYSSRFDAGSDVVLPALRRHNIARLDSVVISHADADHAGGLPGIIEAFASAHYLGSDASIFPEALDGNLCRAGQSWQWDEVRFHVLHPDEQSYDDNDGSCVLLIEAAGLRLLLTGDISKGVESRLLRRYAGLRADVIVAPHHGSRSSSSLLFVRRLKPGHVVFSSGYQNRFNHPAADVVARYEAQGSQGYITAYTGAVSFSIMPSGELAVTTQRQLRRRFWSIGPPR
jgi:competence protein ComEC